MWPWNHLLVGYLLYSGYVHLRRGRAPSGPAVLVLGVGTQLPDLVDKPLAWIVGVLPTGLSLAHSLFFALPVVLVVLGLARVREAPAIGEAFAIGYLSHLLGDVLYPVALGRGLGVGFLFWPIVPRPGAGGATLVPKVTSLWSTYVTFLATPRGQWYALLQLGLLVAVLVLWIADGRPGLGVLRRVVSRSAPRNERDAG